MKKLFNFFIIALAFSCNKNPTQPENQNKQFYLIDIYHGTISLGPRSYWYVKFHTEEGDSIYFEAIVNSGNDISYAFWCDSINFERWKNNENAQLRNYQEAILNYSFKSIVSKGTYYIVLGNSAYFSSKIYWARGYIKTLR
ncbi:MAG: hypothetical protein RQ990_02825 [Candidatus Hydrothermia bacterium]|jgi:hypothetical protein|nr:hypothetical protein [Candidatus Hydrothermia bacterium]